ncbi:MAG: hypothetical protein ACFFBH_02950 [Promethearchaeota archaeon]
MGRAFGIVALIFGIISIPFEIFAAWVDVFGGVFGMLQIANLIIILGWVFIVVAILFGIIGAIGDRPKGLAIAGLILGIIGLIIRFSFRFLFITMLSIVP